MEVFSHNGKTYEGSLYDALQGYRATKREIAKVSSTMLSNPEHYTFEDYLSENVNEIFTDGSTKITEK